jgi:hypothetical protein
MLSSAVSPISVLTTVANTLVARQKYTNTQEALQDLALSAVRSKITWYRQRLRKLERKHATDFETFTARLKEQASPSEEDDWLAWRSAQSMLADWQQTYQDLLNEGNYY